MRKALHLATHRQPMIEFLTGGQATLGYPLPPGFWFAPTEEEVAQLPGFRESSPGVKHPDDLAEAKRLLAEAGFPNGLDTSMMSYSLLGVVETAEVVTDQWRRFLNVDAAIDNVDVNIHTQRHLAGDFRYWPVAMALSYMTPRICSPKCTLLARATGVTLARPPHPG